MVGLAMVVAMFFVIGGCGVWFRFGFCFFFFFFFFGFVSMDLAVLVVVAMLWVRVVTAML